MTKEEKFADTPSSAEGYLLYDKFDATGYWLLETPMRMDANSVSDMLDKYEGKYVRITIEEVA